jgi:midasin
VRQLEESIDEDDVAVTPYFEDNFEGLCQFLDVARDQASLTPTTPPLVRARASLLARRPTKLMGAGDTENPSADFVRLYRYLGLEKQLGQDIILQERFHNALLAKLHSADEVQLGQLDRFQSELQVLSHQLALDAEPITEGQLDALPRAYRSLLDHLSASHSTDVISKLDAETLELLPTANISTEYRRTLETLQSCYHQTDLAYSQPWLMLGLIGLGLYVPNYPHDPALLPMVERKLFQKEKAELAAKLEELREFQMGFTGQETSFRIRQTESAIQEMGEEPPVPAIVRPAVSELDALQGEFSNLLSVIQPLVSGSMTSQEAFADSTLRQNIAHIIRRLQEGYRSYDDITAPAIGFLVCLSIGLTLGAKESREQNEVSKSLRYIAQHTPFHGLEAKSVTSIAEVLLQSCEEQLAQKTQSIDLRWHALHCLSIIKAVDPSYSTTEKARHLTFNIFSSLYGDWKTKLVQDQKEEAKNTSLYTFRGDDEEEEDEDPTLFPDYEQEDGVKQAASSTSAEHAIRLANVHYDIFMGTDQAPKKFKTLFAWCSAETARVAEGEAHETTHENALPAIYLSLAQKAEALASSGDAKTYNFYFDAHLPEAKRLITLIHSIQLRYRQIRKVWLEHATLWEVLRTCDEVLAFRHVDPLAKLITKAEKLHGYMYEWQRVASREYSTANLFDDLTKLLISWRQLELTTWARLFDIEMEKFRDDAKSWFFVAYETLIAAAESIEDEKEMKVHAQQLLKTLEGFFYATTMGQYEQRITLLHQFHRHIAMRAKDVETFKYVESALENFITYFSRYQMPVRNALVKGRQALEKEVNNVIKLASWKDTNIEVLKQSAKTSHRKLSKMVRKFRKLLNQPVSGIVKAGFLDEGLEGIIASELRMEQVYTSVSPTALEICTTSISAWVERPTRFKNLSVTISMMRKLSTPNTEALDGAVYIGSFIADLESSIAQLQKETPNTLTEENKENVQHLKAQKRKLYADTMKELRQMGVKMNLSTDVLARQDELSTVLATLSLVGQLGSVEFGDGAEFFLHKALSIMSQVRDVYKEHSGDLTGNDVSRSIGFLEGLLNMTIRQRAVLSRSTQTLHQLQERNERIVALCGLDEQAVIRVPTWEAEANTLHPSLSWLCTMLDLGADIVAAQGRLGKTSEVDALVREMREWKERGHSLYNAFARLPPLPANVCSEAHEEIRNSIKKHNTELRTAYRSWIENYPISRTVLKHLQPYILEHSAIDNMDHEVDFDITVDTQAGDMFAALDMMLGSMQDVENALKDLPTSTDDAAWLVKEEQSLQNAAIALHSPQIGQALATILDQMQYTQQQTHLRATVAMIACVQPIINQYMTSCNHLVKRYDALHCATAKLLHRLSKSFIQIGTQGFCQPPEKSSDQQQGKDDKLEAGTGLGEGEGAEDISKDIEDDEDLEELAQEKNGEREGSIEEQEDAVDMGEQEMEGETGEVAEKEDQDGEGEEGEDDVQSEVGSVDDLGPSAVDEKMWDEGGKEDDLKDKEGKEDVGTENQDEQVAAEPKEKSGEDGEQDEKEEKKGGEEDEEMEMEGEDQEENVGVGETEQMDPHAKEEETLDLPDDLDIDGDGGDEKEDDLGDMDMDDDMGEEEMEADAPAEPDTVDEEIGPEQEGEEEKDTTGHVEDEDEEKQEEEGDEPMDDDEEAVPLPDQNAPEDESRDKKDDHIDPNAEAGAGADANEEAHQNQKEQASASAANREDGNEGENAENAEETTAEEGQLGQTAQPDAGGRGEQTEESPETQSFKKLGDVLERWYNQQKQISEAREKDQSQVQQIEKEVDMAKADFEHLGDDEEKADTQALGTATEEQATALDQDMAMAVDEEETKPARPEDQDETAQGEQQDVDMQDAEPGQDQDEQQQSTADGRPQAFVGEQKPFSNEEDADMQDAMPLDEDEDLSDTSSLADVDAQLETTHLNGSLAPTPETARTLWLHHESTTHSLSQQLTESLRLILAPTLATKLRGDFRTGKRLNLKRIIPYIASSYKRDKIWLRRSAPSKRNYQVLIALDDSRSMRESGSVDMGLKTLTLVTRALAMLEVGEVGVVGFGAGVNVAHGFDKPFTSEAGVRVFEQFGFEASKTDVRGLVERSLELFADARRMGSSSAGEDLWQLMLVVSDGICDSHAEIQRLVRRAQEERVMIVFVIIDSSSPPEDAAQAPPPPSNTSTADNATAVSTSAATAAKEDEKKTSIMDLQSVEISKEGKVVRWKYMERFPFRYYLVVRDVRELPGVLAGALRQWFGEVAGSA